MTGGIRKGIDEINAFNESRKGQYQGEGQNYLRLKDDGDEARIRILSKEAISASFHEIYDPDAKWLNVVYCPGDQCLLCEKGDRPAHMFILWVYVYDRCHKHTPPSGEDWDKITRGGINLYKEPIGRIMILRQKMGRSNSTFEQFASVFLNYGTFNDRNYILRRSGMKLDTTYTLTSLDKSDLEPDIADQAKELPSLEELVLGQAQEGEEVETEPGESSLTSSEPEEGIPVAEASKEGDVSKPDEGASASKESEETPTLGDDLPF